MQKRKENIVQESELLLAKCLMNLMKMTEKKNAVMDVFSYIQQRTTIIPLKNPTDMEKIIHKASVHSMSTFY